MQFTAAFKPELDDYIYTLTMSGAEFRSAKFDHMDRLLLREVRTGKDVTIADRLLALEMLARRIEENFKHE